MSEVREIGDRQTDAMLKHDIEGIVGFYSDDAVVVTPEGKFVGKEQIRKFMRKMFEPFSDIQAKMLSKFESGTKAMDEWVMKMKNTGAITMPNGTKMKATGRKLSMHGADVYEVHGGHITEHHIYYDQAELMNQLGMSST